MAETQGAFWTEWYSNESANAPLILWAELSLIQRHLPEASQMNKGKGKAVKVELVISESKLKELRSKMGGGLSDSNLCINAVDYVLNNSLVLFWFSNFQGRGEYRAWHDLPSQGRNQNQKMKKKLVRIDEVRLNQQVRELEALIPQIELLRQQAKSVLGSTPETLTGEKEVNQHLTLSDYPNATTITASELMGVAGHYKTIYPI